MPINIDRSKIVWDTPEEEVKQQTSSEAIDPTKIVWDTQEAPKEKTTFDAVAHSVGVSGRALTQGLSNLLGIVGDPLNVIVNQFLPNEKKLSTLRNATKQILKDAGVPDYEGKTEEFLGQMGELATETLATAGIGSAATRAGRAAQTGIEAVKRPAMRVAESLADEPIKQVLTAEGAMLGGEAVKEVAPDSALAQVAGNIVGGAATGKAVGLGATASKFKTPDIVNRGKDLGVDVLTSDVFKPESALGKLGQMVTERAPMGTHAMRTEQLAQKKQMVDNFITEVGANVPEDIKPALVEDILKKRQGMFDRYASMKREIFDNLKSKGSVPIPKLKQVIEDEIQIAEQHNLGAYKTELQNLLDQAQSATQPAGKGQVVQADATYLDKVRALFGEKLKAQDFENIREHINKSKNKIYGAFNEDLGNFIESNGNPNDYKKWKAVNKKISGMIAEEQMASFKRVLSQAKVQPEVVKTMITTQDTSVARQLYKSASPNGKKLIRAAVMQDIVSKANGLENLTADKFVKEVQKRGRAIDVYFDSKNREVLKSMVQLTKDTMRAEKSSTYTPIGVAMPLFGANILNSAFGGGVAGTVAASGAVSTVGLLARVFESKPTRDLLIRIQHLRNNRQIKDRDKQLEVAVKKFYNTLLAYDQEEKSNE